ncbi:MAG TPA: nuclear transport factor 2 family protein [Solirubrobacterales bacterium]
MGTAEAGNSIEARNKATVAEFMEVFSAGNVDEILGMMDESATWWVAGTMEGISGTKDKKGFGEMLGGLSGGVEGGAIRLTPESFIAEGDKVAVETESYAELKNGRVYNNHYHFVFEVRDGKIQSVKEFLDTEHTAAVFLAP